MMRICYMVDAPFLGGAEMYVARLAGALDRRAFHPLVMRKAGVSDPNLDAWAGELRDRGIDVIEIPMRLPFVPWDAAAIWRALEAHAPHVVHVNAPGPYDGQMGLLLPIARCAGARTVVTEHLPMVPPLWKRAAVKRIAYRFLDVAVTMTNANARYLRERQGVAQARVRVVPNGVARSFGAARERESGHRVAREDQMVLVYLGNILPHKGLRRLIEALARCAGRDLVRLRVIGEGPDEAACRRAASERGLTGSVSFLGRRGARETEELLAAADALALPSTIEGLPYVLLEAMACGLPVVAGRVYGIPEVVEDGVTGVLVDPENVDEIARAIDRLARDPDLRRAMGQAGRARFEQEFTLERQARRMESLYRSLRDGGRAHDEP
jgi:glycosyltransferase involved in cell wall biosynthesis